MKEEFVNDVLRDMLAYLDNGQVEQLRKVLYHNLSGFEIQRNEKSDVVKGLRGVPKSPLPITERLSKP